MKVKQKKGISLIVLVITIIVMIILAAAIILSLNGSGVIEQANNANTKTNNSAIVEEFMFWQAEIQLAQVNSGSETPRTADEFFADLHSKGLTDSPAQFTIKDDKGTILYEPIEIIKFKIQTETSKVSDGYEFEAEKGMTWEEWVISDYNNISEKPTTDCVLDGDVVNLSLEIVEVDGVKRVKITGFSGRQAYLAGGSSGYTIKATDTIEENGYYHDYLGGSSIYEGED